MNLFHIIAVLVSLAAVLAYVNQKILKLPTTTGLMLLALANALGVLGIGLFFPSIPESAERFVGSIDFSEALLHGMLGYLLFAGALHVNINDLRGQALVIGVLASLGVAVTTAVVGVALYYLLPWIGVEMKLIYCLLFGSLIAPTDPIAVLAILGKLGAPKQLETKIAGESLFNDGVGVVLFLALLGYAGLGGPELGDPIPTGSQQVAIEPQLSGDGSGRMIDGRPETGIEPTYADVFQDESEPPSGQELSKLFAIEVFGGAGFGLALGFLAFFMIRSINDYKTEVLISLALVTGGYTLATYWHLSGPIAMVVAGLLIGNKGRMLAMTEASRRHLDTFWELVDEILNAVLFVLIGLEVLVLTLDGRYLLAGMMAIPLALLARFISVGGTLFVLGRVQRRKFSPHAGKVVTWAGLRGGVSVALALSLKDQVHVSHMGATEHHAAEVILTMTYVVVGFSIIVQGLTVAPLLRRLGLTGKSGEPH